jgi:HPr kinase/phosphorylase
MDSLRRRTIHGNLVEVYGVGVLLLGDAGTGKTTCSIELLERGHKLVSDDSVELIAGNDRLIGAAPARFRRMANIRPLGLVDLSERFDDRSFCDEVSISLVIGLLVPGESLGKADNIELLGSLIPFVGLQVRPDTQIATDVEDTVRRRFIEGKSLADIAQYGQ